MTKNERLQKELNHKAHIAFSRFTALLKADNNNIWNNHIVYYPSDVLYDWSWHYQDERGNRTDDLNKVVAIKLYGKLKVNTYPMDMTYLVNEL